MNATLRIAWMYFSMLPVQRGLNAIAALLLAIDAMLLIFALASSSPAALQGCILLAFFAGIFSAFGPAFSGGFTLRTLSTRSQLRLRPHGQIRALLGTTLALTLICALFTLPMMLDQLGLQVFGPGKGFPRLPPPLKFLGAIWLVVYLFWIMQAVFTATAWRLNLLLAAAAILLIAARRPLLASSAGIWLLAVAGLAVCLSFAKWYLNTLCIPRPASTHGTRGKARLTLLERLASSRRDSWSRTLAQRQCLLDTVSPLLPLTLGCVPALIIGLPWLLHAPMDFLQEMPVMWMAFPIGMSASISYALVRRARYLWLRAGHDRTRLFGVAETTGLRAAALTLTPSMSLFLAISLMTHPDQALLAITFAVEQTAFAALMFYAGMCATRGWDAGGTAVTAGMFLTLSAHLVLIRPGEDMQVPGLTAALLTLLLLTFLLRRYALHRWLTLDWRIAQVPRLPVRT